MLKPKLRLFIIVAAAAVLLPACMNTNPQPAGLTPVPSLSPEDVPTLNPDIQLQPTPNTASDSSEAAAGAALFELHCTTCHGPDGEGVDAPPLRNSQTVQVSTQAELFSLIANGVPDTEMPAWLQNNGGPLNEGNITRIIAYLQTLQGVSRMDPVAMAEDEEAGESDTASGSAEPARPSNPGDPGEAVNLDGDPAAGQALFGAYCAACHGPQGREETGAPNPGSEDGVVPELNPIDPTLVDADPAVYRANLDLFIEHGSRPAGDLPRIVMPAFGDSQMLTDQQIADLISYVMSLNPAGGAP